MFYETKAQISIEMIVIFAAIIAIVSIVLTNLISTTNDGASAVKRESKELLDLIKKL